MMLDQRQMRSFAEQGYVLVPRAVPRSLLDAARREVARRVALEPPPAGHRGHHSYFLAYTPPDPLSSLLFDSTAFAAAESLIAPGKFEAPDQVQISLNVPPYDHVPGGPHVDGLAPPEADGRPGTFTRKRWREFVQDPLREFGPVREAAG